MEIKLKPGFAQRLSAMFEKYTFEVGVIDNATHKNPRDRQAGFSDNASLSVYAGGPVRRTGKGGTMTVADVSHANSERLGFNYLAAPFKKRTSEIIKFSEGFLKVVIGKSNIKRAENLLQAVVRNPILRGEYGMNSRTTQRIKGFSRSMIDTAQLFKAIKAKLTVKGK